MAHNPDTCPYCRAVRAMRQIMAIIEDAPRFALEAHNEALYDVYEAAREAADELRCYSEDLEG